MPPKRTVAQQVARQRKYQASRVKQMTSAVKIQRAVRSYLNKKIETKRSNLTSSDLTDISHNSFVSVDSTVLATSQGTTDPTAGNSNNRIGDEINLKGVAFKFMLENNHRYSDTTFRILVVKSAKGDTPTSATLFNGLSGNKMMDTLNSERYTVLFSRYVKVKQGNPGGDTGLGTAYTGSGLYDGDSGLTLATSSKIVKFYIKGEKFVKNGVVRYENATSQVKFFDFHVLVYAYSVGATSEALAWQVGRINEYIKVMYYKDA